MSEIVVCVPWLGVGLGAAWFLVRGRGAPDMPALVAMVVCVGWLLAGVVPALLLGPTLLPSLVHGIEGVVVVTSQVALGGPLLYAGLLVFLGWAVPALAGLGWLGLSRGRSLQAGMAFVALTWLGATVGGAAGGSLVDALLPTLLPAVPAELATIDLVWLVSARTWAIVGLGVAGAGLGLVVAAARADLRELGLAALVVPGWAFTVGALTTPPDVVTQLMMAVPIGAVWLGAMALGGAFGRLRAAAS